MCEIATLATLDGFKRGGWIVAHPGAKRASARMEAADAQCCHPLIREGKRVLLSGPENTWSHVLPKGNAVNLKPVPMRSGFQIIVAMCWLRLKADQDLAMVHHFSAELFCLGVPGFFARLFDPAFELRNQVLQNSRVLLGQVTHDAVPSTASSVEGVSDGHHAAPCE
jgi:hypothetical protein